MKDTSVVQAEVQVYTNIEMSKSDVRMTATYSSIIIALHRNKKQSTCIVYLS